LGICQGGASISPTPTCEFISVYRNGNIRYDSTLSMLKISILEVVGLALIYLEFFMPGGIMAIGGACLLLIGLGLFVWSGCSLLGLGCFLICMAAAVVVICKVALFQIKRKKHDLFLEETQEGYCASHMDTSLIGKKATVAAELKPAGYILIEDQLYPALSEIGYVEKGEEVLVVGARGSYFIIRG
jgi:membrane-bound ClpP family serine protease